MDKPAKPPHTYLFTVRLWLEDLGDGQTEWRGKVKNVATGDERYFREWAAVGSLMQTMLPDMETKAANHQAVS